MSKGEKEKERGWVSDCGRRDWERKD